MQLQFKENNTIQTIARDGRTLEWDVSVYDRTRLSEITNVFKEINEYIAYRDTQWQDQLFNVYERIHDVISQVFEVNELTKQVAVLVGELYTLLTMQSVDTWFRQHGSVTMPDNLKEECGPDDPPDRTYLRRDYIDLVIYGIALRPMVPIFGEYIGRIKNEVGSVYKEYVAMRLMSDAVSILETRAHRKLDVYVQKAMVSDARAVSPILNGLGTVEIAEFLLSLVIVRRLSVGDLHASDDRGTVISNIYGFLSGVLKDLNRKFGGDVNEKHREDMDNEDDSTSVVESYKVKQEVSAGEIAVLTAFTKNYINMAKAIAPDIDTKLVKECVKLAMTRENIRVQRFQEVICQWIVYPAMSSQGVVYLKKLPMLTVLGVVQAVLWHWKYHNLAALMTANQIPVATNAILSSETRMRLPNHLVDRLVELYPFTHPAVEEGKGNERKQNVGHKAVKALAKEISGHTYDVAVLDDLRVNCQGIDSSRRMPTPPDLIESIAKLAIQLAEERQNNATADANIDANQ